MKDILKKKIEKIVYSLHDPDLDGNCELNEKAVEQLLSLIDEEKWEGRKHILSKDCWCKPEVTNPHDHRHHEGYCRTCRGVLVLIRGRYPHTPKREVCPTCILEQLEDIVSNQSPAVKK